MLAKQHHSVHRIIQSIHMITVLFEFSLEKKRFYPACIIKVHHHHCHHQVVEILLPLLFLLLLCSSSSSSAAAAADLSFACVRQSSAHSPLSVAE